MGYVAKSILLPQVKRAVFEINPIYLHLCKSITGTTYGDIYKQTIDLTGVDYLEVTYIVNTDGNLGSAKCLIAGVTKFEDVNQASGTLIGHTIDCTGLTGELVLLFQSKNSNGANTATMRTVCIYSRET